MRRSRNEFFNVRPRYSPGSPAMVSEETARRVAADERESYLPHRRGVYGPEEQAKSLHLGLAFIAERVIERPKGFEVEDLLTTETYLRAFSYKKDERAEWFDPERGWQSVIVSAKSTSSETEVEVVKPGALLERFKVKKGQLRLASSVRKADVS